MKTAALALLLCCACSASAAPPGQSVRYTAHFAAGSSVQQLREVAQAWRLRLKSCALEGRLRVDEQAATLEVEFPFERAFREWWILDTLAEPLPGSPQALRFTTHEPAPVRGLVRVDEEWLRYDAQGGERGLFGTQVAAHESGAQMHIYEDDLVRTLLASRGELEFLRAPKQTPLEERARFEAWQAANPDAPLDDYNAIASGEGGPPVGQLWRRHRVSRECALLERPAEARARFGNADLAELNLSKDDYGNPALAFDLAKARQPEFADWTESLRGEGLAIVLDEQILVLATVRSRLPGAGLIAGGVDGFSIGEAQALLQLLRQPRLPLAPLRVTLEFLR